jgi:drug/metabolite transporter (DMT)-like permease
MAVTLGDMVVAFALCSALAYGMSDFAGGSLARRASVWAVSATSQATAAVIAISLAAVSSGDARAGYLGWGVAAGCAGAAGTVLIHRGLAAGRMTIVAPVSAVTAAAVPVVAGLGGGERPGALPLGAVLLALPAVWFVSGGAGARGWSRAEASDGLAAGLAFGVQFTALGQVPESAGLTPLALSQVVAVLAIVGASTAVAAGAWWPRTAPAWLGAVAGVLGGLATVLFQLAAQRGLLTIAGVLTALYPAVTVALAAVALRERISLPQGVGLALAAATVTLVAAG